MCIDISEQELFVESSVKIVVVYKLALNNVEYQTRSEVGTFVIYANTTVSCAISQISKF